MDFPFYWLRITIIEVRLIALLKNDEYIEKTIKGDII